MENSLFFIPKNGNTSLKTAFYKIFFGKEAKNIHYNFPRSKKNPDIQSYFKFAFVRNPYDRLVSAYKNKIISPGQKTVINSKKEIYEDMPFKEFVKIIYKIPDKKINKHFRSQTHFLLNEEGKLIPNFVGRFENLEEDYKKICKKIGIKNPPKLPHENKSDKKKKEQKKSYRNYYDKETKKLVYERYKKDFEFFDYRF